MAVVVLAVAMFYFQTFCCTFYPLISVLLTFYLFLEALTSTSVNTEDEKRKGLIEIPNNSKSIKIKKFQKQKEIVS